MDEVSGRHMLIMFRYDYRHLERFIQTRIRPQTEGELEEVAPQLARFGHSASLARNSWQQAARMARQNVGVFTTFTIRLSGRKVG
jgi:hypothetical protein